MKSTDGVNYGNLLHLLGCSRWWSPSGTHSLCPLCSPSTCFYALRLHQWQQTSQNTRQHLAATYMTCIMCIHVLFDQLRAKYNIEYTTVKEQTHYLVWIAGLTGAVFGVSPFSLEFVKWSFRIVDVWHWLSGHWSFQDKMHAGTAKHCIKPKNYIMQSYFEI